MVLLNTRTYTNTATQTQKGYHKNTEIKVNLAILITEVIYLKNVSYLFAFIKVAMPSEWLKTRPAFHFKW